MRIVYLTAGAAGMYCGSCIHDNSLAKALLGRGHDTVLVPVYTPILTDQDDASENRLFFGGLNVYLQQISPLFRWLPRWTDSFLSSPRLVNWISARAMETSAESLGALTLSMLQGEQGRQRKEVKRLCEWLKSLAPDLIIFTNLLIAASIIAIQREMPSSKCFVVLQGDDLFYNSLPEPFRSKVRAQLQNLAAKVDQFLVHSQDYQSRMSQLLDVSENRFTLCPLSVDADDLLEFERPDPATRPPNIVYMARIAPEKGLHLLVDAFIRLKQRPGFESLRLEIAGWLGKQNEGYWNQIQNKLSDAGLNECYRYWGSVDRPAKRQLLSTADLLVVPTVYADPKGLFALEGLAAGVPYLLPSHGAFPELHARAQAGELHQPDNVIDLTEKLGRMLDDLASLRSLERRCRDYARLQANPDLEAQAIESAFVKQSS
jgi:glycosyltransferase involved in cell wall biosynthesis